MPVYNEIEETQDKIVLWKNPELPEVGTLPFKDVVISWGQAGNVFKPLLKIHHITYPKPDYDRAVVEQIAQQTLNCPFCRDGKALETTPVTELFKYAPASPEVPEVETTSSLTWLKKEWDDFVRLLF